MRRREALSLSALLLASPLLAQSAPGSAGQPADPGEELKRMRSVLEQMQTNLVYLPSGYSAVKHQFELEIDMWRLLLERMERAEKR